MNLMVICIHSSRHKGKTASEMASKKPNLQALIEEHTATNKPVQVNGMSNGSVSPLLKRCSLSNRGKPFDVYLPVVCSMSQKLNSPFFQFNTTF